MTMGGLRECAVVGGSVRLFTNQAIFLYRKYLNVLTTPMTMPVSIHDCLSWEQVGQAREAVMVLTIKILAVNLVLSYFLSNKVISIFRLFGSRGIST